MDRGIWATWYDLPGQDKEAYLAWLHRIHIPEMLSRPGYLRAARVQNIVSREREESTHRGLIHSDDPAVPSGGASISSIARQRWSS